MANWINWFAYMDEGLLDKEFADEIDESVNQMVSVSNFPCDLCKKTYKTNSGLVRHKASKHNINKQPSANEGV